MKTIQKLSVLVVGIALTACSTSKFTSRKYTSGTFIAQHSNVKHNTIYANTSEDYASANPNLEFKEKIEDDILHSDKKIIVSISKSIIKKDGVIITQKKGKNTRLVIKNNLPDVTIIKLENKRDTTKVKTKPKIDNKKSLIHAKVTSIIAISVCMIPIVGFISALVALRKNRNSNRDNPNLGFTWMNLLSIIAMVISSIAITVLIFKFVVLLWFLMFMMFL